MKEKIALLINPKSPIAIEAYRELINHYDIQTIVIANNKKKRSLFDKIITIPFFLALQIFVADILYAFIYPKNIFDRTKVITVNNNEELNNLCENLSVTGVNKLYLCGFRMILSDKVIGLFDSCINIHSSFLPEYRGADPISWQMLDNKKKFGLTIHEIDQDVDTGPILVQEKIKVPLFYFRFSIEITLGKNIARLLRGTINASFKTEKQRENGWRNPLPTKENIRNYFLQKKNR